MCSAVSFCRESDVCTPGWTSSRSWTQFLQRKLLKQRPISADIYISTPNRNWDNSHSVSISFVWAKHEASVWHELHFFFYLISKLITPMIKVAIALGMRTRLLQRQRKGSNYKRKKSDRVKVITWKSICCSSWALQFRQEGGNY